MAKYVSEWANKYHARNMIPQAAEAIHRRRRQMLVHSCIYYHLDDCILSDHEWTRRAKQLAALQKKYGCQIGFYDKMFRNWDGSSGHHLPHTDHGVLGSARMLLKAWEGGFDILVTRMLEQAIAERKELDI